jgi:hypothetical protein
MRSDPYCLCLHWSLHFNRRRIDEEASNYIDSLFGYLSGGL